MFPKQCIQLFIETPSDLINAGTSRMRIKSMSKKQILMTNQPKTNV